MKRKLKKDGRSPKLVLVDTEYMDNLENLEEEERIREELDLKDPNFESELTYDGYTSIEDYDNGVYRVLERI